MFLFTTNIGHVSRREAAIGNTSYRHPIDNNVKLVK